LINPKESGWKHDSLPWFWYMHNSQWL
jgi:hypothetical protein